MEFTVTGRVWGAINEGLKGNLVDLNKNDTCAIVWIKQGVNLAHKGVVLLAALVVAVVTPLFILFDLLFSGGKQSAKGPEGTGVSLGHSDVRKVPTVLEFYGAIDVPNDRGVTLRQIWTWKADRLESGHDYIQWLFPLKTKSNYNLTAPTTNDETIAQFKGSANLQLKLAISLELMLNFYGFALDHWNKEVPLKKTAYFETAAKNWITPGNHNYLRITRILTCLKLHGLGSHATAFFTMLKEIYPAHQDAISAKTFEIWRKAAS